MRKLRIILSQWALIAAAKLAPPHSLLAEVTDIAIDRYLEVKLT